MGTHPGVESDVGARALDLLDPQSQRRKSSSFANSAARNLAWIPLEIGERILAFVLLSLSFPLLCLACTVVSLLSRRSPLVAHARIGRRGKRLWVLKIRTMWGGIEASARNPIFVERLQEDPPPEVKKPRDPRVNHLFAAICRKYSIDELPQLWHVVTGDMALVGPRPLTAGELVEHYGPDAYEILSVKPGLTGLWQIRGRSRLNYESRRRLDLMLVRNWSVRLYMSILLDTVPKVLSGKDAW
jgi:lipopolysaccharide/colanic/teichoic acid biosynthesis glycosyltransferase